MQVLEKILQDIEEFKKKKFNIVQPMHSDKLGVWVCDQIEDIIRSHAKNNGWIPAKERLPEECEKVLVWYKRYRPGKTYGIGWYCKGSWLISNTANPRVIAWMPLPEPPKEEKITMNKQTKLKPCPFCGKFPSIIETECKDTGYKGFFIHHGCWGFETIRTYSHDTEQAAIDVWNRRME